MNEWQQHKTTFISLYGLHLSKSQLDERRRNPFYIIRIRDNLPFFVFSNMHPSPIICKMLKSIFVCVNYVSGWVSAVGFFCVQGGQVLTFTLGLKTMGVMVEM